MRKAFIIILIILLFISLLMVGAWLLARKKAVQNERQAPTFRQFIGLGTRQNGTVIPPETDLSPDVPPETPSSPDIPSETGSVKVSEFTSGPLTPTQGSGAASTGFSGSTPLSGGGFSAGSSGSLGNPIPPSAISLGSQPTGCGDADMNITFTADEIARLRELQNRFYSIAGSLQSDASVSAELANYTAFKEKSDTLLELYGYCNAKAPLIGTVAYRTKVPTPFWRNAPKDGVGYRYTGTLGLEPDPLNAHTYNPNNAQTAGSVLERIFRLNLW